MEIVRIDPQTLVLRGIEPFTTSLIRAIPMETDPGDDEIARERLFSSPIQQKNQKDGLGKEFTEEWKQYVEPGLRHLFQSANDTVLNDLKNMRKTGDLDGEELYALDIPVNHLEQWLNVLNQARLVMAARNAFTEQELADEFPPAIDSTRHMNLYQIHFYALLQEHFIQEME